MFSLQRKLSTTQMAAPASSPRGSSPPLPPTPSGTTRAAFAINPLTVFATPPTSDSCKEGSPTTHSGSNNDKSRCKQHASPPSSGSRPHAESAATSPHSATLKIEQLVRSSSSHADAEPSVARHSLGMLKSIRSLHVDSQQRSRTIARDFSLPPIPVSSLLHENCSSLKDQFLKIKERFSAPSPVPAPKSSEPPPTSFPLSSAAAEGDGPTADLSLACSTETNEDEVEQKCDGEQRSLPKDCDVGFSDTGGSSTLAVDATEDALKPHTKQQYSSESKWPHLQVERWYVEDNFFKGSVTCWTMDKGAEIVGRIATVVSIAEASSQRRINPDISLQWIGRQLWAITVSLPLTRSGELRDEHMELARRIDEAIAAEESKLSATLASSSPPELRHHHAPLSGAEHESNNQVPTVVLREPDVASSVDQGGGGGGGRAAVHAASNDGVGDDGAAGDGDKGDDQLAAEIAMDLQEASRDRLALAPPPTSTAASTPAGTNAAKHSSTSVDTVVVEEEDDASSHCAPSTHEEGDVVASLPLSWSMLSNTSISESGGGSLSSNDPRDDDQRSPPEKTGWLKKKTGLNSWQQRYFELKGNRLYYFASETDGVPRGAIVLDHAHVLRGKGEQSMSFNITTSSSSHSLQILKFSARMTSQVHSRKSCVLRVLHESEESVAAWVTALNRASFYCNLQVGAASTASTAPSNSPASPGMKKKKVPFYRLRASSSSASSADDENKGIGSSGGSLGSGTIECASYHHFGSVKYLQDTNPLLWEIHPHDQVAIRKKATLARTRVDYLAILSKYSGTFRQIFLPRPRPISLEQTLRDILPELFLINNVLYGGGDENNGLENIFEVLDSYIKRFASAQEERVRAVSTLLQACARTISGGDSYFVIHSLLGNPFMIIRPAEARGHPIEIEVSSANPSQFLITVFSAFSFHHVDDVEKYGDSSDTSGGTSMTPEPLLRVKTHHIQEFDFGSGKSSRWLRIRADGMKDDSSSGGGGGSNGIDSSFRQTWTKTGDGSDTSFGALLDPLS